MGFQKAGFLKPTESESELGFLKARFLKIVEFESNILETHRVRAHNQIYQNRPIFWKPESELGFVKAGFLRPAEYESDILETRFQVGISES